jgi:hypothetical protein
MKDSIQKTEDPNLHENITQGIDKSSLQLFPSMGQVNGKPVLSKQSKMIIKKQNEMKKRRF